MAEKKILVVDDEKIILELIKYNLENNGYRVITATNGDEALKMARLEAALDTFRFNATRFRRV